MSEINETFTERVDVSTLPDGRSSVPWRSTFYKATHIGSRCERVRPASRPRRRAEADTSLARLTSQGPSRLLLDQLLRPPSTTHLRHGCI
jgi:hypothetical protein